MEDNGEKMISYRTSDILKRVQQKKGIRCIYALGDDRGRKNYFIPETGIIYNAKGTVSVNFNEMFGSEWHKVARDGFMILYCEKYREDCTNRDVYDGNERIGNFSHFDGNAFMQVKTSSGKYIKVDPILYVITLGGNGRLIHISLEPVQ